VILLFFCTVDGREKGDGWRIWGRGKGYTFYPNAEINKITSVTIRS
jgi:hypothetical protein